MFKASLLSSLKKSPPKREVTQALEEEKLRQNFDNIHIKALRVHS